MSVPLRASGPRPTVLDVVRAADRYWQTKVFPEDQPEMSGFHWAWIEAMTHRAVREGYLDFGVSARTAWVEDKGRVLLAADVLQRAVVG